MNITETGTNLNKEAKLYGEKNSKNVLYSFIEPQHSLCGDKREILSSQIQACERLSNYLTEEIDLKTINNEVSSLKMSLDFMLY